MKSPFVEMPLQIPIYFLFNLLFKIKPSTPYQKIQEVWPPACRGGGLAA